MEVATRMRYMVAVMYLIAALCQFIGIRVVYNLNKKTLAQMHADLNAKKA